MRFTAAGKQHIAIGASPHSASHFTIGTSNAQHRDFKHRMRKRRMCTNSSMAMIFHIVLLVGIARSFDSSCDISQDGVVADCSNRKLSAVPRNLPKGLMKLDLSHNFLKNLPPGCFRGYGNLRVLSVNFNQLKNIASQVFDDVPNLEDLKLRGNQLPLIPSKIISVLVHLRSLDISRNAYNSFELGESFSALKQLRKLTIGSQNCSSLRANDLMSVRNAPLWELWLNSGGPLKSYANGVLSSFSRLNKFVSNCTLDSNPDIMSRMFHDLANTSIRELILENLFETQHVNQTSDIFSGLELCLGLKNITFINIASTSSMLEHFIRHVYLSSLTNFVAINSTFVSNRSVVFNGIKGVTRSGRLQQITIDGIFHRNMNYPIFLINFTLFPDFSRFKVSNTGMNIVNCNLMQIRGLELVDFSSNLLTAGGVWWHECGYTTVLPDTTHFLLPFNKIMDLNIVSQKLSLMPKVYHVDLSYNMIYDFAVCNWPKTLRSLVLSHNDGSNSEPICFSPHLYFLDMSYTLISKFPDLFSQRLPVLKELRLQGNRIVFIPTDLNSTSLHFIDLRSNNFGVIVKDTFARLSNICALSLGHNPYFCTCELYWFRSSFDKTLLVGWPKQYQCRYPKTNAVSQLVDFHPNYVVCHTPILIGITTLTTALTIAFIFILGYYMDALWFIRMGWVWVWAKRRSYLQLSNKQTFRYHAFLSYSHHDSGWVNDCLVPMLESLNPGLRLCIHERDFTPGEWIVDNIIHCIEQSAKTIFVLSRNFVDSEWCHYELYFAHQRTMAERKDSLVLLLIEPLPTASVPHKFCKLRSILGKKTYLVWPEVEAKRAIFWRSLSALLTADLGNMMGSIADVHEGNGQ